MKKHLILMNSWLLKLLDDLK